jgi:hypothetical protein
LILYKARAVENSSEIRQALSLASKGISQVLPCRTFITAATDAGGLEEEFFVYASPSPPKNDGAIGRIALSEIGAILRPLLNHRSETSRPCATGHRPGTMPGGFQGRDQSTETRTTDGVPLPLFVRESTKLFYRFGKSAKKRAKNSVEDVHPLTPHRTISRVWRSLGKQDKATNSMFYEIVG